MSLYLSNRWLQISLRTMFVLLTLFAAFCAWLGWQLNIVRERKAAMAEIQAAGGSCESQRDFLWWLTGRWGMIEIPRKLPFWRYWMGDDDVGWIDWPQRDRLDDSRRVELERLFSEAHWPMDVL